MKQLEGFYIPFSKTLDEAANRQLQALCNVLLENLLQGVTEIYPAYTNLYIEYDAKQVSLVKVKAWIRNVSATRISRYFGKKSGFTCAL